MAASVGLPDDEARAAIAAYQSPSQRSGFALT